MVSLPIGNPEDITLRALRLLQTVPLIVAEDARTLRRLLAGHPLATEILSIRPRGGVPAQEAALARLQSGGDVALVSDCGTPALVDPGQDIIRAAVARGHRVSAVPGASACLAALVLSGLPPSPFTFLGFPPRRLPGRTAFFARIAATTHTIVLYESARYLRATLRDLRRCLGDDSALVIGVNLTQTDEQIFRGSLSDAVAAFAAECPAGAYSLVIDRYASSSA